MYREEGADDEAEGQTMRGVVGGTQLFKRFTLQKILGRGGMGIVWLAHDDRLDRLVALKLVPEAVCFDVAAQEDLKRETRKSLMLTHPNIVRIFDFIEDEHTAGISMEYVDGAPLSYMRVQKPLKCFEVRELEPWVTSLCAALSYAHESAHVIHRDLKPANLMVNSRSELKITDFGIACTLRESMRCVSVRTSSGTLNYMSPQQMLGEDPSPSDDIYALGATLYELLSSKPPFYGGDVATQVREITAPTIAQRRVKLEIAGESIPKYWEETIAACLAKNPAHRPRTAADVTHRLRLTGPIRVASSKPQLRLPHPQQLQKHAAAIAGAGLVLFGAVFLLVEHSKRAATAKAAKASPLSGYTMEAPLNKPARNLARTAAPISAASAARQDTGTKENGTLELSTTPGSASFAIYPGVIASKTAPVSGDALRRGTAPASVEDLPSGRYTIFFHKEGWPDDRTEISLGPGETLPVGYTFPHGSATIASTPAGAEIFLGSTSLGITPLTVDLPPGKQQLTARLAKFPDRTQNVIIESGEVANITFQMRARGRSSSRAKPTPTPSLFDKVGASLKHVFSAKPTPTPRKRR